jgi:hypothetical protein
LIAKLLVTFKTQRRDHSARDEIASGYVSASVCRRPPRRHSFNISHNGN